MRKLIVSELMTLDGVMQAPGDKDEEGLQPRIKDFSAVRAKGLGS
jgi:hypothetical protein